jgi:hypothetical protein
MPSPFPGMDPFLEQDRVWHDFHERAIPAIAELVGAQVDPPYIVKIDEHVFVHETPPGQSTFVGRGDVTVARSPVGESRGGTAMVMEAPARVRLPAVDVERISFVEVRDRDSWQLVTVIELLSPANKRPGADRAQFLAKRGELLASDVHFVELDLLRGGPRLPIEGLPDCDYYALVSRAADRPEADLWPLELRDRLPTIPVPLRMPDPDARLDLSVVLQRVHDAARYGSYIYKGPPQPPLEPADQVWARQVLGSGA